MYTQGKLLFLLGESSLHPGAGEGTGFIDLPIQREGHTGYPKIESSSLKGAVRETFEEMSKRTPLPVTQDQIDAAFGKEDGGMTHGALNFSDARILLFPVRSMKGVFAWITCPSVLHRFKRDYELMPGATPLSLTNVCDTIADNHIIATDKIAQNTSVILEEFAFTRQLHECKINNQLVGEWFAAKLFDDTYWQEELKKHLALVSDNAFRYFVTRCTEVVTRNKINNETGTVEGTALFVEEYLPPFAILYSLVTSCNEYKIGGLSAAAIMQIFEKMDKIVQLGGNATIGKGIVRAIQYNVT